MTAPSAIHLSSNQHTWLAAMEWVRAHRYIVRWEATPFFPFIAGDDDDLFQEAVMAAVQAMLVVRAPQQLTSYFRTIFRTQCIKMAAGIPLAHLSHDEFLCIASWEAEEDRPEQQSSDIEAAMKSVKERNREVCLWILRQPFPVSTKETALHFNLSQRHVCRILQSTIDHIIQCQREMQPQQPTITEFAKKSPIPRKVLLVLQRKQIIQDPLTQEDLIGLHLLEQVWGDRNVLRPQISRMSCSTREKFIRTVALSSKWERYAYSRYFNQEPGSRLSLKQVIEEIQITFRFELSKQQISRIRNIRSKAQVAKYRSLKKMAGEISYIAQTKK
jgi:RNA polymerase sigma factor (sigma-70 family)